MQNININFESLSKRVSASELLFKNMNYSVKAGEVIVFQMYKCEDAPIITKYREFDFQFSSLRFSLASPKHPYNLSAPNRSKEIFYLYYYYCFPKKYQVNFYKNVIIGIILISPEFIQYFSLNS